MSEASQKGLTPQQPWRGLGELPELPLHFRSDLYAKASGLWQEPIALRALGQRQIDAAALFVEGALSELQRPSAPWHPSGGAGADTLRYPSGQWAKRRALIEKFDSPQEGGLRCPA